MDKNWVRTLTGSTGLKVILTTLMAVGAIAAVFLLYQGPNMGSLGTAFGTTPYWKFVSAEVGQAQKGDLRS